MVAAFIPGRGFVAITETTPSDWDARADWFRDLAAESVDLAAAARAFADAVRKGEAS